jgi:hypothetical protein
MGTFQLNLVEVLGQGYSTHSPATIVAEECIVKQIVRVAVKGILLEHDQVGKVVRGEAAEPVSMPAA